MNVKQLIAQLEVLDPSTRVLVDGYEEGLDDPIIETDVRARVSKLGKEHYWRGKYEDDPKGRIKAVVIGRG